MTWAHNASSAYRICTCRACKRAHADRIHRQKLARKALRYVGPDGRLWAPPAGPGGPKAHGLPGTYDNWGCRCPPCTLSNRDKLRRFREHSVS